MISVVVKLSQGTSERRRKYSLGWVSGRLPIFIVSCPCPTDAHPVQRHYHDLHPHNNQRDNHVLLVSSLNKASFQIQTTFKLVFSKYARQISRGTGSGRASLARDRQAIASRVTSPKVNRTTRGAIQMATLRRASL